MSRGVDSAKRRLWRERLARGRASDLSIGAFCAAEGVSAASYYAWRRKLRAARPSERAKSPRRRQPPPRSFQQLVVSGLAPAATARLPGGVAIEIPSGQEAALRTVVREQLRASRRTAGEARPC